jgi:hypothetical protein
MHKYIRRIFAAMSEHAIFYLRIHRPLNTIYPHNIIGPFTRKEAFNHAHQQLRQLATELAHTELRSFVNEIDTALLSSEDKQQLKSMAEIGEYRVHLPDGKTHTIRFHVEHNPAAVRLWRDIRAGTVEDRPTYYVWKSDRDASGRLSESTVERSIEETFTPMQLANERVGVLRLLMDEREGEASNF